MSEYPKFKYSKAGSMIVNSRAEEDDVDPALWGDDPSVVAVESEASEIAKLQAEIAQLQEVIRKLKPGMDEVASASDGVAVEKSEKRRKGE